MTASTKAVESPRRLWAVRGVQIIAAAAIAAVAVAALATLVVFALARQYDGRVLPGIRVGGVDVSSLTADHARTLLSERLEYVASGRVEIKTPTGAASIAYADAGRAPDVDAMIAEAAAIGHSGDALTDAADLVRSFFRTNDLPLRVKVDPAALATRLRQVNLATGVMPRDATVVAVHGEFEAVSAKPGSGLDENVIGSTILDTLRRADLGSDVSVEATIVPVPPDVTDEQAATALAAANRMLADLPVTNGTARFTIPKSTIWRAILFGRSQGGGYGPQLDPSVIAVEVNALVAKVNKDPVNPSILVGKGDRPVGITSGKSGLKLNVDASTAAVTSYLMSRAAGTAPAASVALVVDPVEPKLTNEQLSMALDKFVDVGHHTTFFVPGPSNGDGANIRIPARNINGTVIMPGEVFDFWKAVGPVDAAHGFKMGGVIKDGKSDFTGAMGGGICSASTTIFNAAYNAGLELLERHNHYYYISRYPKGRDATVYQSGSSTFSVRWRNDTQYPVLIVGKSTRTSVTFQIWTAPTGRKVQTATSPMTNIVKAKTTYVQTTSLRPGQTYQKEVTANGFNITVVRRVYDGGGTLIHKDTFFSHYGKVDGIVLVGVSALPPATKTPGPAPTPAPTAPH